MSGRWVIVAAERAPRPNDFALTRGERKGGFCPFCEGNEDRTPPEVASIRRPGTAPNTPGWQVRVVPNKYPALEPKGEVKAEGRGIHHKVTGVGVHEVIVEHPSHVTSPAEMSDDDFAKVVEVYGDRMRALASDGRLIYVLIFKNVGEAAGASLEHSHSQLIAVPVMPRRVHEEMQRSEAHYYRHHRCLLCDVIRQEMEERERVVLESDAFIVISPYAARFPFEMWVMPKYHAGWFHGTSPERVPELARLLREAIVRLEKCMGRPPFNYAIHTAPVTGQGRDYYHWHIELIPRVTRVAGFEWGTGFYINPMPPETAARYLREASDGGVCERAAVAAAPDAATGVQER